MCLAALLISVAGCGGGGGGGGGAQIPGLLNNAASLPQENFSYISAPLETARYFHQSVMLDDGRVLVVGGSDENSFTSIDTVEIYDQSLRASDVPESISGDFITTDFVGDPIVLREGGRLFHTVSLLPNGTAIVIGGTSDIIVNEAIAVAEIFDPQTRTFNAPDTSPVNEMGVARFRHTTTRLANGKLLVSGGQESVRETIIDPNFPPGSPFFQFDITVFPTVVEHELYDPSTREFSFATDISGQPSELQTPRGRCDHGSVNLAGFDNRLGTQDDITLMFGGYQTLSGIFAPRTKFPGNQSTSNQTSVEFYDASTGITATAAGVTTAPRVNGAIGANLGELSEETPDGVAGVANVALFFNGDNNGPGGCTTSTATSDIVVCTFTGFGPGSGIQFFHQQPGTAQQGIESFNADPMNCTPVGRTHGDGLVMRNRRVYDGVVFDGSWVVTAGGHDIRPTPGGCQQTDTGVCAALTLQGFAFFDPFYNANGGAEPEDLTLSRSIMNPTGIVGTWLQADDSIPDDDYANYGETTQISGLLRRARMGHSLTRVGGVDGAPRTLDDRVVVIGGGTEFWNTWGGEAIGITEIYLPPGANQ